MRKELPEYLGTECFKQGTQQVQSPSAVSGLLEEQQGESKKQSETGKCRADLTARKLERSLEFLQ